MTTPVFILDHKNKKLIIDGIASSKAWCNFKEDEIEDVKDYDVVLRNWELVTLNADSDLLKEKNDLT